MTPVPTSAWMCSWCFFSDLQSTAETCIRLQTEQQQQQRQPYERGILQEHLLVLFIDLKKPQNYLNLNIVHRCSLE